MVTHLTKGYAAVTGIVGGVQLHVYRHQFLYRHQFPWTRDSKPESQ